MGRFDEGKFLKFSSAVTFNKSRTPAAKPDYWVLPAPKMWGRQNESLTSHHQSVIPSVLSRLLIAPVCAFALYGITVLSCVFFPHKLKKSDWLGKKKFLASLAARHYTALYIRKFMTLEILHSFKMIEWKFDCNNHELNSLLSVRLK